MDWIRLNVLPFNSQLYLRLKAKLAKLTSVIELISRWIFLNISLVFLIDIRVSFVCIVNKKSLNSLALISGRVLWKKIKILIVFNISSENVKFKLTTCINFNYHSSQHCLLQNWNIICYIVFLTFQTFKVNVHAFINYQNASVFVRFRQNRFDNCNYRSEKYGVVVKAGIWKGQRRQEWSGLPSLCRSHLDSTYCICMLS